MLSTQVKSSTRAVAPAAAIALVSLAFAMLLSSCRSSAWHIETADRQARTIVNRLGLDHLDRDTPYNFEAPADSLRRRLLLEQRLPTTQSLPDESPDEPFKTLIIGLTDALLVGAGNSSEYQNRKESIYRAALEMDIETEEFRLSWAGVLSGQYHDNRSDDPARRGISASVEPAISRLFTIGASVTTRLAFDLARLLTLDRNTAYGLMADASITVPLLRGAGRDIVMEPMTMAEKRVVYAMYDFERYKRSFAAQVASEYLGVLEQNQQIANAEDNYKRLQLSTHRAERLAEAGRLPATQVDQTRQDLLRARERLISARQNYNRLLDGFKRTLGLPVDADIRLNENELELLLTFDFATPTETEIINDETPTWNHDPKWRKMGSRDVIRQALDNRLDLRQLRGRVEDAQRAVRIARNDLHGGLKLEAGATYGERRDTGSADRGNSRIRPERGRYRAVLQWIAPWHRVRERNRYKTSLLDLERSRRDLAEQEDIVKQQIRGHLRMLDQARESLRIQAGAVRLAERRVTSTDLFLQAGRAQIRDVLDAQEALVSARNALLAANVRYRTTEWNLQRDTGLLQITDEGLWHEINNYKK